MMLAAEPRITLEEIVGVSLHSRHLETKHYESAIDRIGALAKGHKLGLLLWHWKYADEENSYYPAWRMLIRQMAGKFSVRGHNKHEYAVLERACRQGLGEWYAPQCRRWHCRADGRDNRGRSCHHHHRQSRAV
jgi:hypothetical protein